VTVADLRQFLVSLAAPLEASGGKSAAADLRRAADGLAPFAALPLSAFADFLARAREYAETGVIPTSAVRSSRSKATDTEAIRAAAESYQRLYERCTDPSVGNVEIAAQMTALDRLTKDAVLAVAREVGIHKSLKTKKDALAEMRRRIMDRKETYDRVRLGAASPSTAPAGT
jgi:hypothetical protein